MKNPKRSSGDIFLLLFIFSALVIFTQCEFKKPSKQARVSFDTHPNVIFIILDDVGYGDLGFYGNPWIQTPVIDSLLADAVRLGNFHVTPEGTSSRAGLLTGKNCNRVGVWGSYGNRHILDANETILPEIFKENGYVTGMFGKWNLGTNFPFGPEYRGFDEVLRHGGGGIGQTPDYWGNDGFDDVYFHNGFPTFYEGYSTDIWFEKAMEFIETNKNKPFFCYLSTHAAHAPYHVAQRYTDLYSGNGDIPNPGFYGMITRLDENLGRLMQHLEDLQLAEHTLLVFLSDNGTGGGVVVNERGFVREGYNYEMRGKKASPYDGGHRVPCFFYWKSGNLTGGKDINELTSYTDVMPTVIDLCNLEMDQDISFDGFNLSPRFETDTTFWPGRMLFFNTPAADTPAVWNSSVVITPEWRLIGGRELYNMKRDSAQRWNVAQYYPGTLNELREAYEEWWNNIEPHPVNQPAFVLGASPFPVTLTAYDWRSEEGIIPWDQQHIRQAVVGNGVWTIDVEHAGNYQFELRRWPNEISKAFNDSLSPPVRVPGSEPGSAGMPLQMELAKIRVGPFLDSIAVNPSDKFVRFRTMLSEGQNEVKTWLRDTAGVERGAYYLYVRKLD
ncbi:MAG: arylsulfatase [Bacteroidota bacterium]